MWRGGGRLGMSVSAPFVWRPLLDPIRFDVHKVLTVYSRRALVGAALGIGVRQNVVAADLVVQGIEAIAGFCLRFRV